MPEVIEQKLKRDAEAKFPGNEKRQDAYVYGALRHKFGWTPLKIKRKGEKEKSTK